MRASSAPASTHFYLTYVPTSDILSRPKSPTTGRQVLSGIVHNHRGERGAEDLHVVVHVTAIRLRRFERIRIATFAESLRQFAWWRNALIVGPAPPDRLDGVAGVHRHIARR